MNEPSRKEANERSLLDRVCDADPGSAELSELLDQLMTQDMEWGPARKKMAEASRKKIERRGPQ